MASGDSLMRIHWASHARAVSKFGRAFCSRTMAASKNFPQTLTPTPIYNYFGTTEAIPCQQTLTSEIGLESSIPTMGS